MKGLGNKLDEYINVWGRFGFFCLSPVRPAAEADRPEPGAFYTFSPAISLKADTARPTCLRVL